MVLEKMQESGVFSAGTYLVGEGSQQGNMWSFLTGRNGSFVLCRHLCRSRERTGTGEGWHEYSAIVQLEEGTYFGFSWANCYDITKNNVPNDPTKHSGMFCVGRDIEPGTYHICPMERKIKISIRYMVFIAWKRCL
ncbi:MAG: hypothetical protein ACLT3Y_06200 [Ruminococcus callidus]